jgi:hypothetical protein
MVTMINALIVCLLLRFDLRQAPFGVKRLPSNLELLTVLAQDYSTIPEKAHSASHSTRVWKGRKKVYKGA